MVLEDLIRDDGFRRGVVAGVIALVLVGGIGLALRRPRRAPPLGLAGIAVVVATLVALENVETSASTDDLIPCLLVLAVGVQVATSLRWPLPARIISAAPGAALIASTDAVADIEIGWVRTLTFVAISLGAALVGDFDGENARAGLGPVLLAVTALGMYTTLPDTEQAAALVGATAPLALLGWPKPLASLGGAGAAVSVGLVAWTASIGGQGRPGAIIGAMACLGVMLVEPVVRRAFRRHVAAPTGPLSAGMVVIAALHVAVVLFVSLAAGREISARAATALSVVAFAVAAVALAVIFALRRPPNRAAMESRRR